MAPRCHRRTRAAARAVEARSTLLLDGGATALAVARALPRDLAVTVVTHSPTVATALVDHPSVEVYVLGGLLPEHSPVTCGAATVEVPSPFRRCPPSAA